MIKPLELHVSRDVFRFPVYFSTHTNIFEYDSTNPEIANSHLHLIHTGNWSPWVKLDIDLPSKGKKKQQKPPPCGLWSSQTDTGKYDINKTNGSNKIAHTHTPRSWLPVKSYLLHNSLSLSLLALFLCVFGFFCVCPDKDSEARTDKQICEWGRVRPQEHEMFEEALVTWPCHYFLTIHWHDNSSSNRE